MSQSKTIEQAVAELYPSTSGGISVGVLKDGKVTVVTQGVKHSGWFKQEKLDKETLFQACSMSKPVFAVIVLKLVEAQVFDLDIDVNEYLEGSGFTLDKPTTMRELLSHTGGTNVHGFVGYSITAKIPSSLEVINGQGESDKVQVGPGKGEYSYSGGGYQVLQVAIEHKLQKPLSQIAKEVLFEPLGMKSSTYEMLTDIEANNLSYSNGPWDGYYTVAYSWPFKIHPEGAAAGLWTNATEFCIFMQAMMDSINGKPNAFLGQHVALEMIQNVKGTEKTGYGLGWEIKGPLVGHNGANMGFRCEFLLNPGTEQGYVCFRNSQANYIEYFNLKRWLYESLRWELTQTAPEKDTWKVWVSEWKEAIEWKFGWY